MHSNSVNVTYKDGATGSFDWECPFFIDGLVGENGSVTADVNGGTSVGGLIELKLSTCGIQLKTGVAMTIAVVIFPLQIYCQRE